MLNNQIIAAEAIDDHRLHIRWSDGFEGDVDFADMMDRGVMTALRDPELFRSVQVDPESRTIFWMHPDGHVLDFCPDALRAKIDPRLARYIERLAAKYADDAAE